MSLAAHIQLRRAANLSKYIVGCLLAFCPSGGSYSAHKTLPSCCSTLKRLVHSHKVGCFYSSRKGAQETATFLGKQVEERGGLKDAPTASAEALRQAASQIKQKTLAVLVPHGVAYHHAALE